MKETHKEAEKRAAWFILLQALWSLWYDVHRQVIYCLTSLWKGTGPKSRVDHIKQQQTAQLLHMAGVIDGISIIHGEYMCSHIMTQCVFSLGEGLRHKAVCPVDVRAHKAWDAVGKVVILIDTAARSRHNRVAHPNCMLGICPRLIRMTRLCEAQIESFLDSGGNRELSPLEVKNGWKHTDSSYHIVPPPVGPDSYSHQWPSSLTPQQSNQFKLQKFSNMSSIFSGSPQQLINLQPDPFLLLS